MFPPIARHYWRELKIILNRRKTVTVAFLGPDGSGKSTAALALLGTVEHASGEVELRRVKPHLWRRLSVNAMDANDTPHDKPNRSTAMSILKVFYFWLVYWIDWLKPKREPKIIIYDRYFHDITVDPRRYRYGGPAKFAQFMAHLVPRATLMVVMDVPTHVIQSRKREVSEEETTRQMTAYRDLAARQKHHIIVNGDRPIDDIVADIRARLIPLMHQRNRH